LQADPLATRQRARLRETSQAYALQAFLLAFSALAVVVSQAMDPAAFLPREVTPEAWLGAVIGSAAVIGVGGWSLLRYPTFGRTLGQLGLLAYALAVSPGLASSPARALLVLLVVAGVALRLRGHVVEAEPAHVLADRDLLTHPKLFAGAVEATGIAALVAWFLVAATGVATGRIAVGGALVVYAVSILYTAVWVQRSWSREKGWARWSFGFLGVFPLLALVSYSRPGLALSWLAAFQVAALVMLQARRTPGEGAWANVVEHPARVLVSTFAALSIGGGVLLSLPISAARPGEVSVVDAFFTSVSATCVTGLATIDVARDLSPVGQAMILALIQAGGIGIMTFSTAGALAVGRGLGMRQEMAVGGLLTGEGGGDLYGAARRILATTLAFEAVGAGILTALFAWEGDPLPVAVWRGVFTSISAFCNAGFALQSDSLLAYQGSGLVLYTVAVLILAGGLGTPVLHALPAVFERRAVSLQARIVLFMTVLLTVLPFPMIAALEWDHALAGLSIPDKIHNAFFQTVSARTAGFASVDYGAMQPATVTVQLVLMFIGGSPFSTAGGVKTTTVALLALGVLAVVAGRSEATAFGRRISHDSIYKSIAIMTMGTLFAGLGFIALQLTQQMPFEMALFEVVSALGTVGLSLGGTAELDGIGKIIVMICMFAGRVGPVTLFLLLQERKRAARWVFPEERVAVG
jgi:trk system potassium uptake protein TrkH